MLLLLLYISARSVMGFSAYRKSPIRIECTYMYYGIAGSISRAAAVNDLNTVPEQWCFEEIYGSVYATDASRPADHILIPWYMTYTRLVHIYESSSYPRLVLVYIITVRIVYIIYTILCTRRVVFMAV